MADLRPITAADLPAVVRRLRAELRGYGLTEANVRAKVYDPDHRPELNLGLWQGPSLQAVLLGCARGERAWIKAATVAAHPAAAEQLLTTFERRVTELGAGEVHVAGAPTYFVPGIDPTDTLTLRFFLEHGYVKRHEAYNMTTDLLGGSLETADEEAQLERDGYECRRVTEDDRSALAEFVQADFSASWRDETLLGYGNDPPTVHVACHAGRIVAFAAAEVTNPGWFGPMGTAPDHRRHGLGRVLLLRCLRDLRELGYRTADIGWVGPLGFYARHCGAKVSRVFWQLRKDLRPL